jgi:hypothetical protein
MHCCTLCDADNLHHTCAGVGMLEPAASAYNQAVAGGSRGLQRCARVFKAQRICHTAAVSAAVRCSVPAWLWRCLLHPGRLQALPARQLRARGQPCTLPGLPRRHDQRAWSSVGGILRLRARCGVWHCNAAILQNKIHSCNLTLGYLSVPPVPCGYL